MVPYPVLAHDIANTLKMDYALHHEEYTKAADKIHKLLREKEEKMAEKGEKCWVVVNDLEHSTVLPAVVHEDLPSESMTIVEFEQPNEGRLIMKLGDHNVWFSETEAWEEARQRLREVENDLEYRREQVSGRIADVDKALLELSICESREQAIQVRGYFIPGDLLWAAFPCGVYQVRVKAIHSDWSASLQYVDNDPKADNWFELPLNQLFVTKKEAEAYKGWTSPSKTARECNKKTKKG